MKVLLIAMALCVMLVSGIEFNEISLVQEEAMKDFEGVKMSPALDFMQLVGYGSYTCWGDLTICARSAGCCSRCCQASNNLCGHDGECKQDRCTNDEKACEVDLNCCSTCCKDDVCVDKFQCTKVQWWFIILVYITLPLCVITTVVAAYLSYKRRRAQ